MSLCIHDLERTICIKLPPPPPPLGLGLIHFQDLLRGSLESINVVPFGSVEETLVCDHSNERYWTVLPILWLFVFANFVKWNSRFFPQFWTSYHSWEWIERELIGEGGPLLQILNQLTQSRHRRLFHVYFCLIVIKVNFHTQKNIYMWTDNSQNIQ